MLSSNAVKKLGKRLRDGIATPADLDLLDSFRAEFEPLLLETCERIGGSLDGKLKYIVAGRMKRTKSIVRKLARDPNSGMDLSRMSDLVGLRIIVDGVAAQDQCIALLSQGLDLVREPYDYRDRTSGYRAVHLVAGDAAHRVEVQIRTLPQHLWADESERLGEQVKEGIMTSQEGHQLLELHNFSRSRDYGVHEFQVSPENLLSWETALQRQSDLFDKVTGHQLSRRNRSYVVVYHQPTNALLRVESFPPNDRTEAIGFFKGVSRTYDGPEYDVLVLNSPSRDALVVTHPRYFPEGIEAFPG